MPAQKRMTYKEIDGNRIKEAILRRFEDIPATLSWQHSDLAQKNRERMASFENRYKGERCVLMANGPSLAKLELGLLKNERVIGMNRIYLLFEKLSFVPEIYVCVNELVLEQFHPEIAALKMQKFLNWNRHHLFDTWGENTGYVKLRLGLNDAFHMGLTKPISSGGTVTFVALQIAYYLGFQEIIIVGLDHSFSETGTPNKVVERTQKIDQSHFHPNYFPKGAKWQLPDLRRSEVAYALAREAFEKAGRQIYDATEGGKCEVFKKVEYQSIFR